MQIQTLANALDGIGGAITQEKAIAALEGLGSVTMLSGPKGTLSHTKHDAGDDVFLSRYSASSGVFEPYDDRKPLQVP
jgi:hypothetical protein